MKRLPRALIISGCLLLAIHVHAFAAAKDTWTSVRSKNFYLIGNASEKDIRQVAMRLEQFRDAFTHLFSGMRFNSSVPVTVIVFKSDGSYKPFKPLYQGKPANIAGYFQSGPDVNYITLTTEQRVDSPYRKIFHEYVHLLVKNTIGRVPVWFDEGLAEYYSTFDVTDHDRKVVLGKIVENHVLYLREQKMMPLRALLAVEHDSPEYNERNKQSIFYAQSWAFVHYLIQGNNGQRKTELGVFLNLLRAGKPLDVAFRQAFQTDFPAMEKELRDYVQRDSFMTSVATFERKLEFDAGVQSAPLREAEAEGYLGDLLLHLGRTSEAAERLQAALALDANLAMANSSLGLLRMHEGKFAEAKQLLERAVAADSQNYLVHYNYAYALSHEGMDEQKTVSSYPPETAEKMRAELKKAIALAPNYTESYRLLAFINLVTDEELDESITLLQRALTLSPGRQDLGLMLAQLYLRKNDFKAARQLLEPLARGAQSNDEEARWQQAKAQSLLKNISLMEEARAARFDGQEVEARTQSPTAKTSAPQTPVDEKAMRRAALMEALRKPRMGEAQARGMFIGVECAPRSVTLLIKTGDRVLKLHTNDLTRVEFKTYAANVRGDITCGPRHGAEPTIVTYRPAKDARAEVEGEAVAVEFLPKDFDLNQ